MHRFFGYMFSLWKMNKVFALLLVFVCLHGLGPVSGPALAGCVLGDCQNGQGTEVLADGSRYVGEWRDGKRRGQGFMVFPNGDRYDGQWSNDLPDGDGILTGHEGDIYEGQFREGVRQGLGTLTLVSGNRYEGEWQKDMPHGFGLLSYPDGSSYSGEFRNGVRHGRGTVEFADGRKFTGIWRDGVHDGQAEVNSYEWERNRPDREEPAPGAGDKEETLPVAPAVQEQSGQRQKLYASVKGDRVNIRTGPGLQYKVINNVRSGFPLQVVSLEGQWARVADWQGGPGWIFAAFLSSNKTRMVIVDTAMIRSGPGKGYPVRTAFSYGTVFMSGESVDDWVQVKVKGQVSGWISSESAWPSR